MSESSGRRTSSVRATVAGTKAGCNDTTSDTMSQDMNLSADANVPARGAAGPDSRSEPLDGKRSGPPGKRDVQLFTTRTGGVNHSLAYPEQASGFAGALF